MIGDNDIFTETRDATAVSLEDCNLLVLTKIDFKKLLDEFPDEARKIEKMSKEKQERHIQLKKTKKNKKTKKKTKKISAKS